MNIFCKPKAGSALAAVSPAVGVPQQADNVNQNSGSFGFCPEKKITWQILELDCAVWSPQMPCIITVVSKIKELEQNCEQANTEVPLIASGVKALYCKPWNPPICISFHSCSLCLPQSHLAQWWCSIFPLMSQPCPPMRSEVCMLKNQMQQSMEVTSLDLSCCWAILIWTGFKHCFLPQFFHLFSWIHSWSGTCHECFLYLHYFLSFTSLKDKTKHQNETLRESFSQNFLLCSSPSHRDVLQLPTRVPISVSPPAGRAVLGSICHVGTGVSTEAHRRSLQIL